ncbi:teicoplanin resistance protein VanZ [Thermaerobacter sp. PB12/4term]|uniref:VanZ family protein n=1 Tax=Thermaerobacter sp. PB12/4term TaxID=2293838 RepID=UPI000E325007|nr:VanZ family protein [Thermaerobacter sp. PB12/4term]QIA26524.1 teicoplanin resistance protein VanZ [Thermaerobacter sp. PB12/4term]
MVPIRRNQARRRPGWGWLRALAFGVYLAVLLRVTVFKFPAPLWRNGLDPELLVARWRWSVNLIPFRTIAGYLAGEPSPGVAMQNLAGNVLIFVPWGLLWVWCWPRRASARLVTASALVTSGILETAEFFLGTGSWDVDDLLLNVLGALLGYGAARVARLGFRRA